MMPRKMKDFEQFCILLRPEDRLRAEWVRAIHSVSMSAGFRKGMELLCKELGMPDLEEG
jgi:hypothetical protein